MEEYGFYLSFNNYEEVIRLPVNPETLEIKENGDSKSYTIVNFGEINVIAYPKLTEITIESMFPAQYYPFVVYSRENAGRLLKPYEYVELIRKWMLSRRPVRFVFSGLKQESAQEQQTLTGEIGINMAVSIESFSWKLSAGSSGDIEYTLGLKKYVFYQALGMKVASNGEVKKQQKRASEKTAPSTYTLKAGDTLWSIAQKHLGDGSKSKTLQKLNNIPDSELKKLKIGRVIKLS
ncbi:LysM peptidoglycan-binding domain-containing protein [Paenibacillus tritici]|uniref:LysM peptidoglycan-binding domain-containing protein n=1 Tax=Paenibacillus tritici TaxID=1873425 RepID=A0ABX2DV94_9BACL|nr:LysM peptidoglycan-binding domain-containing protein [Paenibacillus tritici]